jgi:hypothetical protein
MLLGFLGLNAAPTEQHAKREADGQIVMDHDVELR